MTNLVLSKNISYASGNSKGVVAKVFSVTDVRAPLRGLGTGEKTMLPDNHPSLINAHLLTCELNSISIDGYIIFI